MNEDKTGRQAGTALWARARGDWLDSLGAVAAPDEMTLAAYLDGRLDEAAAEGVEAWMAADSEALDRVIGLRKALAASASKAPGHVVSRAKGTVRGRGGAVSGWTGWGAGLADAWAAAMRPVAWAGVAAALLIASASGFELGRTGVQHLAALDQAVSQDVRLIMGRTDSELL